jgi:hypothetical protein
VTSRVVLLSARQIRVTTYARKMTESAGCGKGCLCVVHGGMTERLEAHVNCLSVGGSRLALHDTEQGFRRKPRSAGFMNRRSSLAAANLFGRIIRYMMCSCMCMVGCSHSAL